METQQSLGNKGISTFLSFGAKNVQPDILEKMLVGRQKTVNLLEKYAREIALHGVNHQVFIVGPRGSGKTHMLRVLYYRIAGLVQSKDIIVAYFAEEEYGISGYLDFLIRIINAFMRWYDVDKATLEEQLNILRETHESRQEHVAETIISDYVADKPLLILSENFDSILEALDKRGQSKLRALLYRHNRISIIATSQAMSPDLGREDRPFYGFFSTISLKKLTYEESLELLRNLAQIEENQAMIKHLAGKGQVQVRAIHELIKGNHRLLVTFYEFLKANSLAELSAIFMKTMNDLKPYYETFIRFLPAQQQKILHYLALAKIPQKGTDIGKNCFIATTSLTKQLSELQRQNLVDALPDPTDKRNKLYDVSEPLLRIAIEIGEQREAIAAPFIDFLAFYYSRDEIKSQKAHFENLYLSEVEPLKKQKFYWEIEARERALRLQNELGIGYAEILLFKEQMKLGDLYYEHSNYLEAVSAYQRATEINPKSEVAWYGLGSSFYWLGDYEQTIISYQKAINLKPDFETAWHNIGLAYIAKGEHQQVLNAFLEVIKLNPNNLTALRNAGIVHVMYKHYDQALSVFSRITKLNPSDALAWNNLGAAYKELGKNYQAFNAFLKATQFKPDYAVAWNNLGHTYNEQGKYNQAVDAFQKVIELQAVEDSTIKSLADTIIQYLQASTLTEIKLLDLETWLQGRSEFEIISSYVTTYRRVIFGKEEKALYELPKEQRIFFEREILKRTGE